MIKQKLVGIIGTITTSVGAIGATLAGAGFCACNLFTIFSLGAFLSILLSFLTEHNMIFIGAGLFLVVLSVLMHRKKPTCKVHKHKIKR